MHNRDFASLALMCCLAGLALGQELTTHLDISPMGRSTSAIGGRDVPSDVIWDNGPWAGNGWASQLDTVYPFNAQTADDFLLPTGPNGESQWSIDGARWIGLYWSMPGPPPFFDMRVIFYADRGDGNAPTGGPADPTPTAQALYDFDNSEVNETLVQSPYIYAYSVELREAFVVQANAKYWVVFQGVG